MLRNGPFKGSCIATKATSKKKKHAYYMKSGFYLLTVFICWTPTVVSGETLFSDFSEDAEAANLIEDAPVVSGPEKRGGLAYDHNQALTTDEIFKELVVKPSQYLAKLPNATSEAVFKSQRLLYQDFWRDKRGALHLAGIVKCATHCDSLSFQGYGCYCGFLGSGEPVDGIDTCCKMHDWCYTTTTCMGIEWQLPYFVPFKWKCNGGAPYCMPGKTKKSDRNSCSHQLCECDREFAMCLQKNLPCPKSKAMCKSKTRLWQNVLMGLGSGKGVHNPYKPHHHHGGGHHKKHPHKPHFNPDRSSERFIQHEDIHGVPHRFRPSPLVNVPKPIYPYRGFRFHIG